MIGEKIIPSFYILELEGAAANLEFLLGKDFGIERLAICSQDFNTDMHAIVAGQAAKDFFMENPDLDSESAESNICLNPEFFPGAPEVELTPEKKQRLEEAQEAVEAIAEQSGKVAMFVTKNFDELGDFVCVRNEMRGDNFSAILKVAVNPHQYMMEKSFMKESTENRIVNPHREAEPHIMIH